MAVNHQRVLSVLSSSCSRNYSEDFSNLITFLPPISSLRIPIKNDIASSMKQTIDIADALLLEAKGLAKKRGVTLRSLVEQGLRTVVASLSQKKEAKKIHLHVVGGQTANLIKWNDMEDALYRDEGKTNRK